MLVTRFGLIPVGHSVVIGIHDEFVSVRVVDQDHSKAGSMYLMDYS